MKQGTLSGAVRAKHQREGRKIDAMVSREALKVCERQLPKHDCPPFGLTQYGSSAEVLAAILGTGSVKATGEAHNLAEAATLLTVKASSTNRSVRIRLLEPPTLLRFNALVAGPVSPPRGSRKFPRER